MENYYDCIIIGGGIAGLQAAIQLGRYCHQTLVIDSNDGRSNLCNRYHNLLGWPEGVSGEELRLSGKKQAMRYDVQFVADYVISAAKQDQSIILNTKSGECYQCKTVLLATGIKDHLPSFPELIGCLGISVYICPDCDGYEVKDSRVIVIGRGEAGANLACTLTHWTKDVVYVDEEMKVLPTKTKRKLQEQELTYKNEQIEKVLVEEKSQFKGIKLQSGEIIHANHCFLALGGNKVQSHLAEQLGVYTTENNHVLTNHRTKETNVENVWAAGDLVAHSEQAAVAMGEGVQAAIWIHKRLLV